MVNQLSSEFDVQTLRRSDVATFLRSDALFIRSCRSLSKECLRTPLQPIRSALFFKTAGCMPSLPNLKLLHQDVSDLSLAGLCEPAGGFPSLSFQLSTFNFRLSTAQSPSICLPLQEC
jgi:hypothetical protein